MLELLAYLNGPEPVARFQRRCGLFLVEAARDSRGRTRAPAHTDKKPCGQVQGTWDHQDNNSQYKYTENGCGVGVSRLLQKQIGPLYSCIVYEL